MPSTFLWKKSIEDVHVNPLFQWLRQNVLLVLQVLAVLFLIYAVLGLRIHGQTTHGKHYILLIDNSASMSATDVAPNRLEWSKLEALKEIDGAGDGDFGMVIVFNSKATTLQAYTNNRGKLRDAVRSIEPTHRITRIDEALALAESLANPVRSTEDASMQPENVPGRNRRRRHGADARAASSGKRHRRPPLLRGWPLCQAVRGDAGYEPQRAARLGSDRTHSAIWNLRYLHGGQGGRQRSRWTTSAS